jgi:hypothetical protein
MPSVTSIEERLDRLEAMLADLAEEVAVQLHGRRGPVEWDDEQGWLRIVTSEKADDA